MMCKISVNPAKYQNLFEYLTLSPLIFIFMGKEEGVFDDTPSLLLIFL